MTVDDYQLEPGLAYDYLDDGDSDLDRGTAVLNAYWLETKVMTSVEYSLQDRDGPVSHLASLAFQAGF